MKLLGWVKQSAGVCHPGCDAISAGVSLRPKFIFNGIVQLRKKVYSTGSLYIVIEWKV